MTYPLTHSKSHNEVVSSNGINLIDCFKRFATKSRSKKKLPSLDWVPKPEDVHPSMNIDAKPKKYGSSSNVNQLKVDYAQSTLNYIKFKSRKADLMNQSCYGKLSCDDYDNMSDFVKYREPEMNVRRTRKAVSEVDAPTMNIEKNRNSAFFKAVPKTRDMRKSYVEGSLADRNTYTSSRSSSIIWNDELKPLIPEFPLSEYPGCGQNYGHSVITGGSSSTFSPPVVAVPAQSGQMCLETAFQQSDGVFSVGDSGAGDFNHDSYRDRTLRSHSYYADNHSQEDVSRLSSISRGHPRDVYAQVQPLSSRRVQPARLEDIKEMSTDPIRNEYRDYKQRCKELDLAMKEIEMKYRRSMEELEEVKRERDREVMEKEEWKKKFEDLNVLHQRTKEEDANRLFENLKIHSNPHTPLTERLDELAELDQLTNSVNSISSSDRPPLPISQSMNFSLTPATRYGQGLSRRPTSLISSNMNQSRLGFAPTPHSAERCKLTGKKELQGRSTSTTPDSGAMSINGELAPEIAAKMDEVQKNMLMMMKTMSRLKEDIEGVLKDEYVNVAEYINFAFERMSMVLERSKRVTSEEVLNFLESHAKQLWEFSNLVEQVDILLVELSKRSDQKIECNVQ
ncbi:unnamed protein product [Bursaphelenchus xylophilus]|uniref:(pine wood nematode) hypothetical protein n=1 Tax=Bursaphelenchus xylophilus TaxID=6326 RepID=A0A7I8X7K2_BURXY|nr:unnamed protein product [Bursaphelenchus xylophilus]CAG9123596.1 unnamed protein product [Bursaphelenchus xylophilus]